MSNSDTFDEQRGGLTRRSVFKATGIVAAAAILAGVQRVLFGSGGGSIGGPGGGSGWMCDMYKTTYCFDDSGFVQDGADPSQGWEKDSIDYFWNLLTNEIAHSVHPGAVPRPESGAAGSSNYNTYYGLIGADPSLSRFVDSSWPIPRKMFYALATQALDRARSRISGTKARMIAFGCVYGFNEAGNQWQFLNVSANLQAQNGFYYYFFPAGADPEGLGRTTLSLTLPDRDNAIGLISPGYTEGWSGTLWDSDASVDPSDGNIGSNPGENWRDYIYRRAVLDTNGELGTLAIIAVADKEPAPQGSLTVKKICNDDHDTSFGFRVTVSPAISGTYGGMQFSNGVATFTLRHNQEKTATNIPFNTTYEVEETTTGTDPTWSGRTGTITATASNASVTCTNVQQGKLVLQKVLTGSGTDATHEFDYVVTLTDKNNNNVNGTIGGYSFSNGKHTFKVSKNSPVTISNIPAGYHYSVTESDPDGEYEKTAESGTSGTIGAGATATASFTNAKKGELRLVKVLTGSGTDTSHEFDYVVTLKDANNNNVNGTVGGYQFSNGTHTFKVSQSNSPVKISNIPLGYKYSVTESDPDGWYEKVSESGTSGTISAGTVATASFTNAKKGEIRLVKVLTGNGYDTSHEFDYVVTLKDANNNNVNGTVGGYQFSNGTHTFKVSQSNSPVKISKIPLNYKYSVTESDPTGDYEKVSESGTSGTIAAGTVATASFTNAKKGELALVKQAHDTLAFDMNHVFKYEVTLKKGSTRFSGTLPGTDASGATRSFNFVNGVCVVDVTVNKSPVVIKHIPLNEEYSVTEQEDPDYEKMSESNTSGTVPSGTRVTVTFSNRRKRGYATIEKHLSF